MKEEIVVIHQPDFLPYLGFFDRLLKADIYVILDTVQYVRNSSRAWTARDKIKTETGEKWIKVGTKKAPLGTAIKEIEIAEQNNWREDNLNLIRENYKEAPFFDEVFPYIEELYAYPCERMMDFNVKSLEMLMDLFDIHIKTVLASDMEVEGKNNELVINIVKKLDCHKYLSGVGARDYYEPKMYEEAGVEVIWQEFEHPVYPQQYGEFLPYLSSIDLLLNCGIEASRKIIRGKKAEEVI